MLSECCRNVRGVFGMVKILSEFSDNLAKMHKLLSNFGVFAIGMWSECSECCRNVVGMFGEFLVADSVTAGMLRGVNLWNRLPQTFRPCQVKNLMKNDYFLECDGM